MLSEVEVLWITIRARSIILLACTISIACCTVSIWYKINLETILWTLFTEAMLLISLSSAHCYSQGVGWILKRKYHKREDETTVHPFLLKYGFLLVGFLWLLMFSVYAHYFFSPSNAHLRYPSSVAILGSMAVAALFYSAIISSFFAYGVWYSYWTIILHTIPTGQAEQGNAMVDIPPAAAEADLN